MEKEIIKDVLNDFYSGIISDVSKLNNDIILTIDMTEFKEDYHSSIFKCELKNCKLFEMKYKKESIDINKFKKYRIKISHTEILGKHLVMYCYFEHRKEVSLFIDIDDIKVKDEDNKEVSLLDLSIYGGLCTGGPGVTFLLGKTFKEAERSKKYVHLDASLASYLKNRENYYQRCFFNDGPIQAFDWLLELDPYSGKDVYGEQRLSNQEVNDLIKLCDALIKQYNTNHLNDQKLKYFAVRLKELCNESLEANKFIFIDGE